MTNKLQKFFNQDCADEEGLITMGKRYLHSLERQDGKDATRMRDGRFYLSKFIFFCLDRGIESITQVSRSIIDSYQHYLVDQVKSNGMPYSATHRRHFLTMVSSFFKWLIKNNHILHNPAGAIEIPKQPHQIPYQILSVEEVERILEQPDTVTVLGIRDRAMLETLYSTGICRAEMRGLKISDIDFAQGIIRVSNGIKKRAVPIGNKALKWIERYLSVRSSLLSGREEDTLLIRKAGHPLSACSITERVTKYIRAAKIDKRGACCLFRYAMATLMLENGADLRYVQQMLGHADISSTQRYTDVSIQELLAVHAKTHPAKLEPTKTEQIIRELEKPE